MSEMVERVVRALALHLHGDDEAMEAAARAAIEAMRQPTQAMIDACDLNIPAESTITGVWGDMIEAALASSS